MPHSPVTWRDRLRYRFENTLARGPIAIIAWLALVSAVIVALAALTLALFRIDQTPGDPSSTLGLIEGAWQSAMHAIDAGNLAGDQGWPLRLLMLVVTIGGIFIVSILIGTITSGLESRLDELRKGRSRVIERDHTLILGWSSKVYSIIGELLIANRNQRAPRIVILAGRDKVDMEDDIRAKFPDLGNTRVICRSGDPLDLDDLAVVDPHGAKAIVILAPGIENPDIYVIKSVLAITNNPARRDGRYHIVAEIRDARNEEAAALVGGDEALFVRGEDLIARLTAQTCRQSGLSVVYTELLDFDGAEIYLREEPSLVGKRYRDALVAYEQSAVMGLLRADGSALINPPMDLVIDSGDQLIAISEDDDTMALSPGNAPAPNVAHIVEARLPVAAPERTLLLGGTDKAEAIILELENYVAEGSEVLVVTSDDAAHGALSALTPQLRRQRLELRVGDITRRATLDALDVGAFDHVILLSDTRLPMQEADAQTLITLLHLRNIANATGRRINIVSEMMDLRNRALAQVARADDFIVSDKLISLMLSQLAENRHLHVIFKELFGSEGSEIYLRPAAAYVAVDADVDFHTIIEAAARRGETAIGYRDATLAEAADQGYGVRVNPRKSVARRYAAGDQLIVLAEG
jgi:voltage-gated potassium channel Kch